MSDKKYHSKPLSRSDCTTQQERRNIKLIKLKKKESDDQINDMHESVIIENELFSKKVKSNLGESYCVYDRIDMDKLRKSEHDAIKEQDNYAKYKKTKKYIKKGGKVFATGQAAAGAFFTFLSVSKYVLAFL